MAQTKWIDVKESLPELGSEYNVVWDLHDGYLPTVTTMQFDAINKKWLDIANDEHDCTEDVLFWAELPEPPKSIKKPKDGIFNMPIIRKDKRPVKHDDMVCSYCGWKRKDHRNGHCYEYSDQSEDYFYRDKFFTP